MAKGIKTGGRKPGSRNKATLQHIAKANEAARQGITPLQVILRTMRELWKEAVAVDEKTGTEKLNMEKAKEASAIATVAAPYVHPKLNSIDFSTMTPPEEVSKTSVLERARRVAFILIHGAMNSNAALPAPSKQAVKPKTKTAA